MHDMIVKGAGNSRFMKSSIPADISHEELVALLRDGTFPFDLNGLNPDGIAQAGTPLSKANLLSDATAALFGLDGDAVPDDMFGKIASSLASTNKEIASSLALMNKEIASSLALMNKEIASSLALMNKVEIIEYTGTGGNGRQSNAVTLTFRNKPLYIIVMSQKNVFEATHYLAFLPVFSWDPAPSINGSSAWFGLRMRTIGGYDPYLFPPYDNREDTNGKIVDNTVSFWRYFGDSDGRYSMNLASIKYIAIGFCEA